MHLSWYKAHLSRPWSLWTAENSTGSAPYWRILQIDLKRLFCVGVAGPGKCLFIYSRLCADVFVATRHRQTVNWLSSDLIRTKYHTIAYCAQTRLSAWARENKTNILQSTSSSLGKNKPAAVYVHHDRHARNLIYLLTAVNYTKEGVCCEITERCLRFCNYRFKKMWEVLTQAKYV